MKFGDDVKIPFVVDFTAQLEGFLLSGTPVAVEVGTPASLAAITPTINAAAIPSKLNPGRDIAVGKAVLVPLVITAPKADATIVRVTCATTNPDFTVEHVFEIQTTDWLTF